MNNTIDEKLIKYIPKKLRTHIVDLVRENKYIHFVMIWNDGFQRSRRADNIAELKEMVTELEYNRESQF